MKVAVTCQLRGWPLVSWKWRPSFRLIYTYLIGFADHAIIGTFYNILKSSQMPKLVTQMQTVSHQCWMSIDFIYHLVSLSPQEGHSMCFAASWISALCLFTACLSPFSWGVRINNKYVVRELLTKLQTSHLNTSFQCSRLRWWASSHARWVTCE